MENMREIVWSEKYRPRTIKDCILPENIKKTFQAYVDSGEIPTLLLCGPSGTGKTTAAMAMCDQAGLDHILINGSEENGIDTLRVKIKGYASTVSLTGGRKVIIVDEADYMNANSLQPALRGAIEEFSHNTTFIFTCNFKNRIIDPLQGRCATVDFAVPTAQKQKMSAQFFKRLETILKTEKVEYDPKVLVSLIMKFFPNYRKMLNELQQYSVSGKIDEGILVSLADVDLKDLCKYLKEKDFVNVRKWVNTNSDNDPARIYRRIYDGLSEHLKPNSVPEIILILAKYQYQHAFSADEMLNLLACMVEIMITGEFK